MRRINDWRFWVLHTLFAPAVITPAAPLEHTVKVVRAWRTATEQTRRAPHSALRPGIVTPASGPGPPPVVTTILTKLAVRTRSEAVRHPARYVLRPPTVTTPPTLVPATLGPVVTLVGLRKGKWQLKPPVLVNPVVLLPPVVTTIQVTLAGRTRVEQQRHATHARLQPPTVLAPPPPPSLAPAIRVISRAVRQRRDNDWRYFVFKILFAPAIVTPAAPLEHTVRVHLAGRTRTEQTRHFSRTRIQPPQFLQTAPLPPVQVKLAVRTRVEQGRHGPHSKLAPPVATNPVVPPNAYQLAIHTTFAGRTRRDIERRRRLGSRLAPPAVVTPVPVTTDRLRMMRGLGL